MMHTHSDRLERWLGSAETKKLSDSMKDFYWPVAVAGVPGSVYAMPGGDFTGEIKAGSEISAIELGDSRTKSYARERRALLTRRKTGHRNDNRDALDKRYRTFSSISQMIAATTAGKGQFFYFRKAGTIGTVTAVGSAQDLWVAGGTPVAGSAGAAAPGGTVHTNASTGAIPFTNPTNSNTLHYVNGYTAYSNPDCVLLYDRLFSVAKTMSSTSAENVTGVPTRYQNGTGTAEDYIGGSFIMPTVTATLNSTAHNWTVTYTNQASVSNSNTATAVASAAIGQVDVVTKWFLPLVSGDIGVKNITQLTCSASVTGSITFVIGHPIAFFPNSIAGAVTMLDGTYTAFNLPRVYDNACLAFLDTGKQITTAQLYTGMLQFLAE